MTTPESLPRKLIQSIDLEGLAFRLHDSGPMTIRKEEHQQYRVYLYHLPLPKGKRLGVKTRGDFVTLEFKDAN